MRKGDDDSRAPARVNTRYAIRARFCFSLSLGEINRHRGSLE